MAATKKRRTTASTDEWWHAHFASNSASEYEGIYTLSYGDIGIVERRQAVLRILQYYLQPTKEDGSVQGPFVVDAESLGRLRKHAPPPLMSFDTLPDAHSEMQWIVGYVMTILHFVPSTEMILSSAVSMLCAAVELNSALASALRSVGRMLESGILSICLPALTVEEFPKVWVGGLGISKLWLHKGLYEAYIHAPDHTQEKDRFATMATLMLFHHTYDHRVWTWCPRPILGTTLLSMLRELGKPQRPCLEKEVVAAISQVPVLHAFPPGVIPIVAAYEGRSCPPFQLTCRCGFLGTADEKSFCELFPELSSVCAPWMIAPRDSLEAIIKQKIGNGVVENRRAWAAMYVLASRIGITESLAFVLKNVNLADIRIIQSVVNIAMMAVLYRMSAIRIPLQEKDTFWLYETHMTRIYLVSDFDPLYSLILAVLKSSMGIS